MGPISKLSLWGLPPRNQLALFCTPGQLWLCWHELKWQELMFPTRNLMDNRWLEMEKFYCRYINKIETNYWRGFACMHFTLQGIRKYCCTKYCVTETTTAIEFHNISESVNKVISLTCINIDMKTKTTSFKMPNLWEKCLHKPNLVLGASFQGSSLFPTLISCMQKI